jgi:hypothetical protein
MRNAIILALGGLLAALPAAGRAQIGTGGGAGPGPGAGTVIVAPPGGTAGGIAGPAIGSTRPYYRDYAYRDRMCWHDRGYRHCRWR